MACLAGDVLYDYHFGPAQVAAIVRYVERESGCVAVPPAQPRLCGGPCYGAFQWDAARWREAITWMRERGLDPRSLEAQTHFAVAEFLRKWPVASRNFLGARDERTAFRVWVRYFGAGRVDPR